MKTLIFAPLFLACLIVSGWCAWYAYATNDAMPLAGSGLFLICAVVAWKLGTAPDGKPGRWYVLTPGLAEASGPYDLATLAAMWKRGQLPPGTQVSEPGHDWRDVAAMVKVLDAQAQQLSGIGLLGGTIAAFGVLVMFFASAVIGGVLTLAGILIVAVGR